jgi:hypothetical protein
MKYTILFKETSDVFKGEKQSLYDCYEAAETDAKRIATILNEISDERVSYKIIPADDPDDIMMHSSKSQRQMLRPTYHYVYTEVVHERGFNGLTTYEIPDLNIKITAENAVGLSMLKEAARLQLEYLVETFDMDERFFPPSRKLEDYPDHIKTGMIAVSLNPIIEQKKQELEM